MRKISKTLLAKDVLAQSRTDLALQQYHSITPDEIREFEKKLIATIDRDVIVQRLIETPLKQD